MRLCKMEDGAGTGSAQSTDRTRHEVSTVRFKICERCHVAPAKKENIRHFAIIKMSEPIDNKRLIKHGEYALKH